MKFKLFAVAALAGAVVIPQAAFAQEYGPDDTTSINKTQKVPKSPEEKKTEEETPLSLNFRVTNELHAYNNLDMLPLNEDTNQDILQTDDRQNFGYTSLAGGLSYKLRDDTTFSFGASLAGLWGNDQIGTLTSFGSFAYIYDLSVNWQAVDSDALKLSTRLGRQDYSIGGAIDDYFFKDIVDGATLDADFGAIGRVRLMFDIFGDAGRPRNVNFLEYISANKQTTNNFRGDTNVYRYGGVYELTDLLTDGLDARVFGFGSTIGAARASQVQNSPTTGADISEQGVLGNFADNDYTWLAGARINYHWDGPTTQWGVMGEYARSGGIDRKARRLGLYDVNADGNAFGAGAHLHTDLGGWGLEARARFFRADGPKYTTEQGLPYSHGFVSMKGSQIGGINMNRYAGWHPSAYVSGFTGIYDNPQDISRRSGTMMLHGGLGFLLGELARLDLDGWYFKDTGSTNFDVSRAEQAAQDIEYGYTLSDLKAEARLGKTLGTEWDATLTLNANDALSFYAIGGLFLPGDFYNIRIDRTAGTALGAPNGDSSQLENFWVASAGATVAF